MNSSNKHEKLAVPALQSIRLLDQIRERVRFLNYSLQTEKVYLYWAQFFIRWHGRNGQMRHPREMGKAEVESFLTMLANERQVAPATHRQPLNALLLLYRQVLDQDLPSLQSVGCPPERKRIPVVLTAAELHPPPQFCNAFAAIRHRHSYGARAAGPQ